MNNKLIRITALLSVLLFLACAEAGAQQLLHTRDTLFTDRVGQLVMVDSSRALALGDYDDYSLRLVQWGEQQRTKRLLDYKVEEFAYSPAAGLVAAVPYDDYENPGHEKGVRLIDMDGQTAATLPPQAAVAFAPDGRALYGIDDYNMLRVYDLQGAVAGDSLQWTGTVYTLMPGGDDRLLIYGERQGREGVWLWQRSGPAVRLYDSDHQISQVLRSNDYIVIAEQVEKIDYHHRIQITVLAPNGQVLQQWQQEEDAKRLTLSPGGNYLAGANYLDEALFWYRKDGTFHPFDPPLEGVDAEALSFISEEVLAAAGYHTLAFVSMADRAVMQTVQLSDTDDMFAGTPAAAAGTGLLGVPYQDADYRGGLMVFQVGDEGRAPGLPTTSSNPGQAGAGRASVVLQSGHRSPISSLAFGRDAKVLFSGDEDGMLLKWDLRSGLHYQPADLFGEDEVFTGGYGGESPLALAYNPALNHLAVTSDNNVALPVLDAETMKPRFSIPVNYLPRHPVYSPDGRYLAFEEDEQIKIYEAAPGAYRLLHALPVQVQVNDLHFGRAGKWLAAAMIDNTVRLIDVQAGRQAHTLAGHTASVTDLAFAPDGRWLYSLDFSSNIRRWSLDDLEGELFYESTYTGTHSMTVENGTLVQHLQINELAFGDDAQTLYTTGSAFKSTEQMKPVYSVLAWDTDAGEPTENFAIDRASGIIHALASAPDGGRMLLATGGADQQVRIWDGARRRVQVTYGNAIPEIEDAIPYFEEQLVLSTISNSEDFYRLQRWDLPALRIDGSLDGVQYGTNNLVLDPVQSMIGTEFVNRLTWMSFEAPGDSVSFSPDTYYGHMHAAPEQRLLFGYNARDMEGEPAYSTLKQLSVDVYDTGTGSKRYTIETPGIVQMNYENLVPRFDRDGKRFALQTGRGEVTIYRYDTGEEVGQLQTEQPIVNMQFGDGGLYVWHEQALGHVTAGSEQVTKVQALDDPVYDPAKRLAAAGPGRLAWVSEDRQQVRVGRTRSYLLQLYDVEAQALKQVRVEEVPQKLFFLDGARKLVAVYANYLSFYDTDSGTLLGSAVPVGREDYFFYTPDFYYASSRDAYRAVGFMFQNQMISFDQLDLWYNRPDIVMERMGLTGSDDIDLVHEAYTKRLAQSGFDAAADTMPDLTTLPAVTLSDDLPMATRRNILKLQVTAVDTAQPLASLHLYANGVPVRGRQGVALSGNRFAGEVEVELLPGVNKIQVSARNSRGYESLRETIEVEYRPPSPPASDLYLLSVNVSDYRSDNDLQYARKDGQDLVNLYVRNAALYDEVHIDTLFDQDATLERIRALKQTLMQTRPEDRVILFVSGHGLLDEDYNFYFATYDTDFENPAGRGISYEQIEWLLDGIPARRKLLLIDACHSGEVDRLEMADAPAKPLAENVVTTFEGARGVGSISSGSVGLQNSFELMQQLFANLNRGSGAVVISAAAGDSYALESDEWRNGVFTYSVLDGLKNGRADANGDGEVTVSELRGYVYAKVVEETGGRQKPTTRQENLEFDFRVW